jgi:hypothetical protein
MRRAHARHARLLLLLCAACTSGARARRGGRAALSLVPPPARRAPPPLPPAVNWAAASLGATATANSAGYWVRACGFLRVAGRLRPAVTRTPGTPRAARLHAQAGYTALPSYALDGDTSTFWSSTGGAECCSESAPAWLMVALGAPRPVAALQLLVFYDMTFTLALANASDGPFATVALHFCETCRMNDWAGRYRVETFALRATATASFVKLTVTWSAAGGVGGCADQCDWASDVYDFRALSPGALPAAAPPPPPPAAPQHEAVSPPGCDAAAPAVTLIQQSPAGAEATLTGGAAQRERGAGHAGDAGATLTGAAASAASSTGAVEFTRIIRPAEDCRCEEAHMLALTVYIWMGGGVLPGEGLVISLVDATRQTPGATRFMSGCGVRAALPAHALSIVLDTADSDAACDEPGTGARIVSTLDGEDAPPRVMSSTLELGTSAFRRGAWTPVQLLIKDTRQITNPLAAADSSEGRQDESAAAPLRFAPWRVWLDGTQLLDSSVLPHAVRASATLREFYIVVSARTGSASMDVHAISGLRLECPRKDSDLASGWIINWAGLRQPLTPPPFGWPPPPTKAAAPGAAAGADLPRSTVSMRAAALSCLAAFVTSLSLASLAAAAWHCRRHPRAQPQAAEYLLCYRAAQPQLNLADEQQTTAPPPLATKHHTASEVPPPAFHAFLSYRRADWRIVDAVHDKLRLAGVRVFKDVDGQMAGRPFDVELLLAVHSAAAFAPVVTLASLQRLAGAAAAGAEADTSLAEWLAALYFRDAEEAQQHRSVRLIHPLLVGQLAPPTRERAHAHHWLSLRDEPAYAAALAALPAATPAATVAMVDGALRRALGRSLPPRFACLTVRQIVCGCDDEQAPCGRLAGILSGAPFALECAEDDLGLYVQRRYAPALLRCEATTHD